MTIADLRNLPDAVLNRLDDAPGRPSRNGARPGLDVVVAGAAIGGTARAEQRHHHDDRLIVDRNDDDEAPQARHLGYAYVSAFEYDVYGGPPFGFTEVIEPGAAAGCLHDDVRYLFNHTGMPLARTVPGTLELAEDDHGLLSDATVDLRQHVASDLTIAIDLRNVDQMSFAFRVERQEWNDDYTHRRILQFDQLFDTSSVTFPANPATVIKTPDRDGAVPDELRRLWQWELELARGDTD